MKRIDTGYQWLQRRYGRQPIALATSMLTLLLLVSTLLLSHSYYRAAQADWLHAQGLQQQLASLEQQLQARAERVATATTAPAQSLVAIISATASAQGIAIARMQPQPTQLLLTVERADFSALLEWLAQLQLEHNVVASETTLQRLDPGQASLQATLIRLAGSRD